MKLKAIVNPKIQAFFVFYRPACKVQTRQVTDLELCKSSPSINMYHWWKFQSYKTCRSWDLKIAYFLVDPNLGKFLRWHQLVSKRYLDKLRANFAKFHQKIPNLAGITKRFSPGGLLREYAVVTFSERTDYFTIKK